jgi:hypothetical protein
MLSTLIKTPIDMLESLVATLEKYESNQQVPKVFSKKNESEKEEGAEEAKTLNEAPARSNNVEE